MSGGRRFSLESAFEAAERGDLATWVGDFLASRGSDNAVLAAALAQRPHFWVGPIRVPIDALVRMAGPDGEEVSCPVEPEEWERDVDAMEADIEDGWRPPPLLAEHRDGQLFLQDGNHRYEALERAGAAHAWVIIWFDDADARDRYLTMQAQPDGAGPSSAG